MTTAPNPPVSPTLAHGWKAQLNLTYEHRAGCTRLIENSHTGPLRVQLPLYPEGEVCHTYILHPPGGVVAGDQLEVKVTVNPNSHALLTTPGATKFYRSSGATAAQRQHLKVNGGMLEWFPQDNIIFPGAIADIDTQIHLDNEARFIGWEVLCLGLPTRQEPFTEGSLINRLVIFRNNQPVFLERLAINSPNDLATPAGLRGKPVVATFIASNADLSILDDVRQFQRESDRMSMLGFTLVEDLLIGRYFGDSTFEARELFQEVWNTLRPVLLSRPACAPRIWAT